MKVLVEGDLYDISSRIKQIDSSYFVIFDNRLKRYEVHSHEQRGDTLCFLVPYKHLDQRTLDKANLTRIQNIKRLISQIDLDNQKLEHAQNKQIVQEAMSIF